MQRRRATGEVWLFVRRVFEIEGRKLSNERSVRGVHNDELARGEQQSAVAQRHRFLGSGSGFWGCAKSSK